MLEAIARSARILAGAFVIALLISAAATPSRAQITISDQFNFSDTYGVNPVGNGAPIGSTGFYQGGTYDSVGADSVTPSAGTTVTATQATVTYNLSPHFSRGRAIGRRFRRDLKAGFMWA